jgi:hypothetical protein
VSDEKPPSAFVPLKAITHGPPDAAAALAEIRQIYFRTSPRTIANDFAHAIELLKSLPDDDWRYKAHVYMEGLAEMRNEWGGKKGKGQRSKGKDKKSTGENRKEEGGRSRRGGS